MKKIVFKNNWWRNMLGILVLAGVLSIIYGVICAKAGDIKMPSLLDVLKRFGTQFTDSTNNTTVLKALGITLFTLGVSLFFSLVIGLVFGFFFGRKEKWIYIQPTVDFLRSIPMTFLIPILAIIYATGDTINIYLLTIYPTSLIIMFGVRNGIQNQDLERLHFFKVIASKQKQPKRYSIEKIKLTLFEALPHIFAQFRIALSYGLVIVTVLEYMFIGVSESSTGIGTLLYRANENQPKANVFALVLLIGVIGFFLNKVAEWIQNKLIHWSNENLKNE